MAAVRMVRPIRRTDPGYVFAVPAVADAALGTAAEVQFADAAGQPVEAEAPATVVAAGTSVVQPLDGALTGASEPEISAVTGHALPGRSALSTDGVFGSSFN